MNRMRLILLAAAILAAVLAAYLATGLMRQRPPVGPEFMQVVEGQRLGITIDQGVERMFERIPLPEVSFLGIVISIQSKSGGNLSEALNNLSKVLRDRKKLKGKVRSMS